MKSLIRIAIAFCLMLPSIQSLGQEQNQTKTTTTTTTTTSEQNVTSETQSKQQSQENTSSWKGLHAGVIGQATFTNVKVKSENSSISTSYVVGYGAGGFIGYFFNQNAELRIEGLYSSLAQEISVNGSKSTLNLSYINFPLLFGFHTSYNKPISFNIMAGPQLGINTASSVDVDGNSEIDTVNATINIKPADIGIAYGAGIDFGFGPERLLHLNVGFRGVYGIVDIGEDSNNNTTSAYYILDRSKLKTYSGYAGLSYKF